MNSAPGSCAHGAIKVKYHLVFAIVALAIDQIPASPKLQAHAGLTCHRSKLPTQRKFDAFNKFRKGV
jgi:hypothetical protein